MSAHPPRLGPYRQRLAAVLTALTCALLASAAVVPAAFARTLPDGGPPYAPAPTAPVGATSVQVVTAGGMPGWQIALIAVGAAILGALLAVLLDRARSARRLPATTAA